MENLNGKCEKNKETETTSKNGKEDKNTHGPNRMKNSKKPTICKSDNITRRYKSKDIRERRENRKISGRS